jgi:hypothetical protein
MPRGGQRENAGRKSGWEHSETVVIRVPQVFAKQLLEIARKLDMGESIEFDTKSKPNKADKVTKSKRRIDSVTNSSANQLELVTESTKGLSGVLLGKRLGCAESTVRRHRDGKRQPPLGEWSLENDPEGVAWQYNESDKKYYPIRD